jgi:hypothetical protein
MYASLSASLLTVYYIYAPLPGSLINGNYSCLVDFFDYLEQRFLLRASRPISNKTPYNLTKVYSPINYRSCKHSTLVIEIQNNKLLVS